MIWSLGAGAVWPLLDFGQLDAQVEKLRPQIPYDQLRAAANLYEEMIVSADFPEFLTLRAYEYLD